MTPSSDDFMIKGQNPFYQTAIVAGMIVVALVITALADVFMEMESKFYWTMAAAFLLFFAVFNSVFSLGCKDIEAYWKKSIPCFFVLMVLSGVLAWLFSGLSIHEAYIYKGIYVVLGFGYLVFLSIISFMKRIVEFAEQEDWQAPKKRKR